MDAAVGKGDVAIEGMHAACVRFGGFGMAELKQAVQGPWKALYKLLNRSEPICFPRTPAS